MTPAGSHHKYLDPSVLSKIDTLELRARLVVEGFITGAHRSPYRGLSIEFADHRSYTPGDDIRHIDWKVFGRTDKYYVKEYEQQTNLNCVVMVDQSESMRFASDGAVMSKLEYAACAGAALGYVSIQQHDAVGLGVFDSSIRSYVKPSSHPGHWRVLVGELDAACRGERRERTAIKSVLFDLAERLGRRSMVVIISDLFDEPDDVLRGIQQLRYHNHEVIVCHVWDPAELRFSFVGPTEFRGLEGSGRLMTQPQALRSRYLAEVDKFVSRLRRGCRKMQTDYVVYDTSTSLDVTLSAYLANRQLRVRQRSSRVMGGG